MNEYSMKLRLQCLTTGVCYTCFDPNDNLPAWNCKYCSNMRSKKTLHKSVALRQTVLDHYGNKCACCGEAGEKFLNIDHINGLEGKKRKTGYAWYKEIVEQGFPENLRLLCWNCNMGREKNGGICPHEEMRQAQTLGLSAASNQP